MAHLDDQNGQPPQQRFLDLSALKPQTREEVQNALHKLSEVKLRPEKLSKDEDVVSPESWNISKSSPYLDPVPSSMLHVDIPELSKVDIDWKMLTLDRPETAFEIIIFSRIVYLYKVTLKCIEKEKARREKAQSMRLRMKGRVKVTKDTECDKIEELTYEFFSRHFGANDRRQAMEEVPKPPTAEETKVPQPPPQVPDEISVSKEGKVPSLFKKKRKKKFKKRTDKKKKKCTKRNPSKVRPLNKKAGSIIQAKCSIPSFKRQNKSKNVVKPVKKTTGNGRKSGKTKGKSGSSSKTLVQMLKISEKAAQKKKSKEKLTVTLEDAEKSERKSKVNVTLPAETVGNQSAK